MQPLRETIATLSSQHGATVDGDLPADVCPQCIERHACWTCHDGGRVKRQLGRDEEGFGQSVACPDCFGGLETPEAGWLAQAMIPAFLAKERIETFRPVDHPARIAASEYVETWPPERPMLLLGGPPGNGKSHLAVGVLWGAWERHGVIGRFRRTVDILDALRAAFSSDHTDILQADIRSEITRSPLLVLDDLGAESGTGWAWEQLYAMIDRRYADRLPTVVTTNASPNQLPPRIASRVRSGVEVILAEPDYRRGGR